MKLEELNLNDQQQRQGRHKEPLKQRHGDKNQYVQSLTKSLVFQDLVREESLWGKVFGVGLYRDTQPNDEGGSQSCVPPKLLRGSALDWSLSKRLRLENTERDRRWWDDKRDDFFTISPDSHTTPRTPVVSS